MPFQAVITRFAVAAAMMLSVSVAATAADPAGEALAQAVDKGASLFAHETFGGNGNTCETCHVGGGKVPGMAPNGKTLPSLLNAAAIYPRFSRSAGQVVTLEGQIYQCIRGGLGGTPPAAGSPDLVAIAAYLGSIAQGQVVGIGTVPK